MIPDTNPQIYENELEFKLSTLPEPLLYGLYHAILVAAGKWHMVPKDMDKENTEQVRMFFSILHKRYGVKPVEKFSIEEINKEITDASSTMHK